ncbi:CDP-glycerol glycerophosphotransferase family protein [Planotetraspora sp. A-T 1434]|uniref:bifunctional glycosyltransferase/CDP-glycerol:glycerophosphate glycerophosphotransferase n=1 Tax=Planotetraspora sp. A-T 1434 TaxID=2979219 RepID=UPI0021C1467C|nr:CDP-glycerol glycerophosphotransferase family protein [Planotetraspora sp. A-T 1434]MCT9934373.1 CDP-glycerol glycerophosphotransferase family protein [Planotetraspora sp. A-T 1434]
MPLLSSPDVTVVVIVYNDAERLPNAVRSVLEQSLRGVEVVIVDDASTDSSAQVAEGFARAHPDRVRAIRLPENSGGCGRPRNVGIGHARGSYVMFLDSDDTLDRHACRNMVAAAEETGADLVSGRCVRVYSDTGDERSWYPSLYRRRAVLDDVLENPTLLYDTLSTNKCYRRDFLERANLSFVEGLHYEDLLFSAQAYVSARRIAIIPHRVYNWFVVQRGPNLSITNRRNELRGFADRLTIHRAIDEVFRKHDAVELKRRKDAKFLNHDLVLYLRELRSRDADYRREFLDLARAYLAELGEEAFDECKPLPAIGGLMVLHGDYDAALAAADYLPKKGVRPTLSTDLVERDGRVYWCDRHLDGERERRILDVTDLGVHSAPFNTFKLGGRVTEVSRRGSDLHVAGDAVNPLGRIGSKDLTGTLEFRDRQRKGRAFRVQARVGTDGRRIHWEATFPGERTIRPIGLLDQTFGLWLVLSAEGQNITVRLTSDVVDYEQAAIAVRPRLTRLAGDHMEFYVPESGELALRTVATGWPGRVTLPLLRKAATNGAGARVWGTLSRKERDLLTGLKSRKTKIAVYNSVLRRLPVRKGTVVFESHLGAQYSDNPKYIYEELARRGGGHKVIWSYKSSPKGFPKKAELVKRGSWAYYRALARAEYWVDNQGFPAGLIKPSGTTYIQTWHGSAFKQMGFDEPQVKAATRARHDRMRQMVGRFDHFVIRSEHDRRTLVKGLGVTADLLETGYPRNDPLVTGGDPKQLAALRRRLGLGDDRTVVLYAPTFRADEKGRPVKRFEIPFELERFVRELGRTHVLLIRAHYLSTVVVPPGVSHAVVDVGDVHDVSQLLLLSDVLVTDYSSLMFDYALLDRPIVFYTPDADTYVNQDRGAYFDLAEHAPGPIVTEEHELFATLRDTTREKDVELRRRFVERFGEYDTGTAAKTIVDRFFPGGRRG